MSLRADLTQLHGKHPEDNPSTRKEPQTAVHCQLTAPTVVDTTGDPPVKPPKQSPSKIEWQRQKDVENAINTALDDIMEMTGLEEVKSQILNIKAKVDACIRQNLGLYDERFGAVLFGNPGTGQSMRALIFCW